MDCLLLWGMTGKILLKAFQYTFGLRLVNADKLTHNDVLPEPGLPQMSMAKEQARRI